MDHIVELHHKLMQNRIEAGLEEKYVARTAKTQRQDREVDDYLRQGYSVEDVSYMLNVHPHIVRVRLASVRKDLEESRQFISTGRLPRNTTSGNHI